MSVDPADELRAIHDTALGMARHVGMLVELSYGHDPVRRKIDPLHIESFRPTELAESPAAAAGFIASHRSLLERNNSQSHWFSYHDAFSKASTGESINEGCAGFFGPSWHGVAFLMFQEMAKLFDPCLATKKWPGPLPAAVRRRFQRFQPAQLHVRLRDEYRRACEIAKPPETAAASGDSRPMPNDPISLTDMAKLGMIGQSTVRNWGTKDRPQPCIPARGKRAAVFSYQELREWFISKQPDKADSWPEEFKKARATLTKMSRK